MGTLLLKMLEKGLVLICAVVLVQARTGLDSQWEDFKSKYVKVYSVEEEEARRAIWEDNYDFIERHNAAYEAGLETYSVGENEYNDLTHIEFTSMLTGLQPMEPRGLNPVFQPHNYSDVRSEVDWRTAQPEILGATVVLWTGPSSTSRSTGSPAKSSTHTRGDKDIATSILTLLRRPYLPGRISEGAVSQIYRLQFPSRAP